MQSRHDSELAVLTLLTAKLGLSCRLSLAEALQNMLRSLLNAFEVEESRENDHGYRVLQARCPTL